MTKQKKSMKTWGARILCSVCGAQPYPDNPATIRETFSLLRYGPNGFPAASPAEGEWRCEQHPIARQDLPAKRAPRPASAEALTDFENTLGVEIAHLNEAIADDGVADALGNFRKEVERGFTTLRKAVQS